MKKETAKLISEATKALRLRDIVLFQSRLFRETPIPEKTDANLLQQHRRGVTFATGDVKEGEDSPRELHVIVSLGERAVDSADSDDPTIYFGIEADYLVIYEMIAEVSEKALHAFSDFNAVHNVWPFWRQHVYDLVGQARWPHFEVPLFSGYRP